jgi:HK97 family phage major capsid protein
MSKLAKLRNQRNSKSLEFNALNDKFPGDTRVPVADSEKLESMLNEIESIDREMALEKRAADLALENPQAQHEAALNSATRDPGKQGDDSKALRAFLTGGLQSMAPEDRARMLARQTPEIRNAMSTTTTTEGGFTTALEYQKSLEMAMRAYGGMRAVSRQMRTGTGITMNFPTVDATLEIGRIVGQNFAVVPQNTSFGNTTLDVYKYTSDSIALPFELVQDSFIDIEAYVQELLAMRLGRITNTHFTVGSGTGQPFGIVPRAASGKVGATGTTVSVGYDDLVDLEHSVDPAYRSQPGVGYMMHDTSVKALRKIKDTQNRPIFVPGYEADALINGGAPDRLMGRPIYINQDMPVMGANAKSILFGQLGKYVIRDVMDLTLFRMTDSAYTLNGQIGFVAFLRAGGNLIDAGGAVRVFQNSAT